MKKARMRWFLVAACGVLVVGGASLAEKVVSYLVEEPYDFAVISIESAIGEKDAMLGKIEELLDKELDAYEALEELLDSGDYGDLKKGDIVKAKQKIHSAMQHEEQCADALEQSNQKLKDALAALGWEHTPLPEPISLWTFDEGQGDTAYDWVGENHGTVYGPEWTEGQIGDALDFDGHGDYVAVPDVDDSLDFGQGEDFSISLWFRIGVYCNDAHLVNKRESGGDKRGYWIFYGGSPRYEWYRKISFQLDFGNSNPKVSSQRVVDDGLWHHVVALRTGATFKLYLDGVKETEITKVGFEADLSNSNHLIFGMNRIPNVKDYDGALDEVAIYDYALSDAQVELIYECALDEFENTL